MKLLNLVLIALVVLPVASAFAIGESSGRGDPIPLGKRVSRLPSGCEKITTRMTTHFYRDGLFYRKSGSSWLVVRPPTGAVVRNRPRSAVAIRALGVTFYYHDGFFYRQRGNSRYEVIRAPSGAVVRSIPKDSRRRLIGGKEHYWYAGVTYRVIEKFRRVMYQVRGI